MSVASAVKPVSRRMTLAAITKGREEQPMRLLLVGSPGVGKSTLAAGAPAPIFICPKGGSSNLDIARFPDPECWQDVRDAVRALAEEPHDYKTCVIDELDAIEGMLWADLCAKNAKKSIEDFGYGKGYVAASEEWRLFVSDLERLRKRGMAVILIAHCTIRTFNDPQHDGPYDRFEAKLHKSAAGLLREWSDATLFCTYETFVDADKKKGFTTGVRVMHTEYRPAWDAKNRWGLPPTLPLSWDALHEAISTQSGDVLSALRKELIDLVPEEKKAEATKWAESQSDAGKLRAAITKYSMPKGAK